ncbi:MAG: molybdate ABC transporter substrate-binding protein [bacterium]|nr:molybdate ABC transporter substrate-binding protein [bacterium]
MSTSIIWTIESSSPTSETGHERASSTWVGRPKPTWVRSSSTWVVVLALCLVVAATASAGEVLVAVAANFAQVAEKLEVDFERASGHRVTLTTGSTGKLYAQVRHGAPFDVVLAADALRPRLMIEEGRAVEGSRFTYALGRLTLWSPRPDRVGADGEKLLRAGEFRRLAIANPDLAPYGAAARDALTALGLWDEFVGRIVRGEDAGQAHAMVATGNAEFGLLALSLVLSARNGSPGSRWDVPSDLYQPIRQDAVLLKRAADNPAARAFLDFLKSADARRAIVAAGYGVE